MNSDEIAALKFAEEQLAILEAAEGPENEMAGLYARPSAGQGFMLVTDRLGRVQLDQDSAFICSRIQFLGVRPNDSDGSPIFPPATQLGFAVRDAGSSIVATLSKWKQGLSVGSNVPVSNSVSESQFACVAQLVPQTRDPFAPTGQVDYVYTLSARWIIPRGSTIITSFSELPGGGLTIDGGQVLQYRPQLLFLGRKVYG